MTTKTVTDILCATAAIAAALLWIKSATVEVWADGQTEAKSTNMVMYKNGRLYDVTGTAEAQSTWSARAAYAAAAAAALQAFGLLWQLWNR
ncbi:hypothetical protein [Bradyrhizobium sp.]|uniref:hypothetical protein n=1 Tax=Bradyrhizobium sp. TaxID=376 RepID=UPI00261D2199|nr:hypothetical protein [Bradyrhizobium sp.]